MKIIQAKQNRLEDSGIYIQSGGFEFKIDHAWAKWPDEIKGSDVLCPTCDEQDNLYVTTSHPENPICVFNSNGIFVRSFGKGYFDRPHSIAFTPQGNTLVADSGLHVVQEMSINGELIQTFGTPGIPSDTGYEIKALDKAKTDSSFCQLDHIRYVGKPFNSPCHMAVASTGEMFAADGYGNAAVHKFASDGTYLETWGGPGKEIGQYRLPHWLNIDLYDRVWVCDRENSRAYAYTTNGEIIALVQGGFWRIASCWSDRQFIYFGERRGGMFIVDIDRLEVIAQFGYPYCNMFKFHGLGGDSKGNLFISSISGARFIGNLFKLTRL